MRSCLTLLMGSLIMTTSWSAESSLAIPPGVAVGVRAPEFKLHDQSGTERTLNEFLKKGKVAIVFHRSVRW